ncbi:MAG: PilW family protein [Nitrospiraceae bacterium]
MKIHRYQQMVAGAVMATRWREERGFTLIELMAALIVALVIVGAGFTALTTSDKASRVNDLVAETQQNVRIGMELISRDVKTAGFGMMTGAVGTCANAINPQDNNTGGADTGPDAVALVVPLTSIVAPVWTLQVQVTGGPATNTIVLQPGAAAAMTTAGLAVGSTVSIAGAASGTVAAVAGATIQLVNPIPAPAVFPADTQVYLLQCITYAIGTAIPPCTGTATCLLRGVRDAAGFPNVNNDPAMVAIADGIEDLQLTYACDGCVAAVNGGVVDGLPDDQNGSNTFDTADFISNNPGAPPPLVPATIRLVQISIVARQLRNDQGLGEGQGTALSTIAPVVVGDHNPTNDAGFNMATYQQIRRRVLIRTVDARNLGL